MCERKETEGINLFYGRNGENLFAFFKSSSGSLKRPNISSVCTVNASLIVIRIESLMHLMNINIEIFHHPNTGTQWILENFSFFYTVSIEWNWSFIYWLTHPIYIIKYFKNRNGLLFVCCVAIGHREQVKQSSISSILFNSIKNVQLCFGLCSAAYSGSNTQIVSACQLEFRLKFSLVRFEN